MYGAGAEIVTRSRSRPKVARLPIPGGSVVVCDNNVQTYTYIWHLCEKRFQNLRFSDLTLTLPLLFTFEDDLMRKNKHAIEIYVEMPIKHT